MTIDISLLQATPHYNNAIAEDMVLLLHHKIINDMFKQCPVIKQVLCLFKIWLTQRDLRYGLSSFDSHSTTLLLAFLYQFKMLNSSMSAMSGFQVVMKFLSDMEFPVILSFNSAEIIQGSQAVSKFSMSLFHPLGSKDKYIEYNAFWRILQSTAETLKKDAKLSLALLQRFCQSNNQRLDHDKSFQKLFLTKVSLIDREDIIFHLNFPAYLAYSFPSLHYFTSSSDSKKSSHSDPLNEFRLKIHEETDEISWSYIVDKIHKLLKKALSDRIISLTVSISPFDCEYSDSNSRNTSNNHPKLISVECLRQELLRISIGITISIDKAVSKVDRGPLNSSSELEIFREFWGEKCQLRRFQDGVIVHAVVWEGKSWGDRGNQTSRLNNHGQDVVILRGSLIAGEIVNYMLSKHFPVVCGSNGNLIQCPSLMFEECQRKSLFNINSSLDHDTKDNLALNHADNGNDIFLASKLANEALDALRTILASKITGMPIMIESLQAVEPELRYTSLFPVQPHPLLFNGDMRNDKLKEVQGKKVSLFVKPIVLLGTLESSGKWPNDIEAVNKLKSGLLLKIMELIKAQNEVIIFRILQLDIY